MSTPPITVVCPSCSTKFSVADHMIRGKLVKFRCKKCQGTIECDGRALSASPPPMRAPLPRIAGQPPSNAPPRMSDPPMRLSISDGIDLQGGAPSLAPPRVPHLSAPPTFSQTDGPDVGDMRRPSDPFGLRRSASVSPQLMPSANFTWPPTAVPEDDDPAQRTATKTPIGVHAKSDPLRQRGESGGTAWRSIGVVFLIAAAGVGGWVLARQSAPPNTTATVTAAPLDPQENKQINAIEPSRIIELEPAEPAKAIEAATIEPAKTLALAKTIEPAKAIDSTAIAPIKAIDPIDPQMAKAPPAEVTKLEGASAASPAVAARPTTPDQPATPAAATETETANVAVNNEHEFDKAAARTVLADAGDRAASCRGIDTPAGAARVAVTFAPSGKVTSAIIESGPFAGTAAGGCVVSKFRNIHVPPFTGDEPVTVHKTLSF